MYFILFHILMALQCEILTLMHFFILVSKLNGPCQLYRLRWLTPGTIGIAGLGLMNIIRISITCGGARLTFGSAIACAF
jgi:hypothetical protein